jgi:hypothetical protein
MFEAHLAPVGVDLLGDDGREAGRDALTEFDVAQVDGDRVVGPDADIIAQRGERDRAGGGGVRCAEVAADGEAGRADAEGRDDEAARGREGCGVSHGGYPMISEARATAPRMRW